MAEDKASDGSDAGVFERLDAEVAARFETHQVPFLQTLVDAPSHTYATDDVEAAAGLIDEFAASLGMDRHLHPDPEGVFATHRVYAGPGTTDDGPALALVGHIDTVFPRSMGFLTFSRDPGGDIARGPGVLDMKSGLTVIAFALRALRAIDPGAFARLRVRWVLNTDEEVGSPSSHALFESLAPSVTGALVFEAGRAEDAIVVARKGSASFRLTAYGTAAHAGLAHQDGVNAIHVLALLIPKIEALTAYDRGVTLNVGIIEGGTAKNTVPDQASCTVDARFVSATDARAVIAEMTRLSADPFGGMDVPERLQRARIELGGGLARPPMEGSPESERLLGRYGAAARAVGLLAGKAPLQGGGSDANILAACGVPCIDGLGPYGRNFHKVEEWCSLDSLRRRTQALARFLADWAGTQDADVL